MKFAESDMKFQRDLDTILDNWSPITRRWRKNSGDLANYAVNFRYDAAEMTDDPLDRSDASEKAQRLYDHVEQFLNDASTEASQSENDA